MEPFDGALRLPIRPLHCNCVFVLCRFCGRIMAGPWHLG